MVWDWHETMSPLFDCNDQEDTWLSVKGLKCAVVYCAICLSISGVSTQLPKLAETHLLLPFLSLLVWEDDLCGTRFLEHQNMLESLLSGHVSVSWLKIVVNLANIQKVWVKLSPATPLGLLPLTFQLTGESLHMADFPYKLSLPPSCCMPSTLLCLHLAWGGLLLSLGCTAHVQLAIWVLCLPFGLLYFGAFVSRDWVTCFCTF